MKEYPSGQYPNPTRTQIHNARNLASHKMEQIWKDLSDELGIPLDKLKVQSNHFTLWIEISL